MVAARHKEKVRDLRCNNLWAAGKMILGAGLTLWIIRRINFAEFQHVVSTLDGRYFVAGVSCFLGSMFLEVMKFYMLLHGVAGFGVTAKITCIGNFFNNFLPSSIGGDVYKILSLGRQGEIFQGAGFVLVDRVIGLFTLSVGSLALFIISPQKFWVPMALLVQPRLNTVWLLLCFSAIFVAFCGLWGVRKLFVRQIRAIYVSVFNGMRNLTAIQCVAATCLSGVFHMSRVFGLHYFLLALGTRTELAGIFVAMAFVAIISMLPLSIGSLGIREGAFVVGLGVFGVNYTVATTVALLFRVVLWGPALIGGVFLMLSKK